MVVFHKLCRTAWSSVHKTESVSVMGKHSRRKCVPQGRTRDSKASFSIFDKHWVKHNLRGSGNNAATDY